MTPIPHNSSYNEMILDSLQNNDSQLLSTLNDEMVKTRIMEYIETNSGHLDLTNTKLDFLSGDIFNLSMCRDHLYKLSLNKNILRDIPESISNLLALNIYISLKIN